MNLCRRHRRLRNAGVRRARAREDVQAASARAQRLSCATPWHSGLELYYDVGRTQLWLFIL